MPDRERIQAELSKNRNAELKLIESQLPELGNCKFGDYFTAAIGKTLYEKFMANYTWKMWNIPGDELETSMVWADRFQGERGGAEDARGQRLRSTQVRGPHARQRRPFQVYPKRGWNAVWDAMVARATVVRDSDHRHRGRAQTAVRSHRIRREAFLLRLSRRVLLDRPRHAVGREHAPVYRAHDGAPLIPGLQHAFPEGAESVHYSSCEFQTRVTEMKVITRHDSPIR